MMLSNKAFFLFQRESFRFQNCSQSILGYILLILLSLFILSCQPEPSGRSLSAQKWEKITLSFNGPETSEDAADNPFLNYRLMVSFTNGDRTMNIPGFYAADGDAAESGAASGSVWQARFRPDQEGEWRYSVSFRKGENIAISDDPEAGEGLAFDGESGTIEVGSSLNDSEGRLIVSDDHYLRYADSGRAFLKGGADSPENFLAYEGFDGTFRGELPEDRSGEATAKESLHTYSPHIGDWKEGDPSWQGGKGKGIIGALNYLAGKGMNSVYFLTMNIGGDGKDVWPYTGYDERFRFDCSKLDQWEIVFDHMDDLGLMLHVVTQETENEKLLDDGDTGLERKLYYRELIARFAHHLGLTWNMGEENGPAPFSPDGQTIAQQKAMSEYLKTHDPYQNFLVIHTHSVKEWREEIFDQLLGFPYIDGPSIQTNLPSFSHEVTKIWRKKSAEAGKAWIVNIDEIGHHSRGVDPDDRVDNNQDTVRANVLWGNLMAGGGGVEWYFGYLNHNNDLGCEDWRSRDRMWEYTKYGLDFFNNHLPFDEMQSRDELMADKAHFCFAKEGAVYAVYMPFGGSADLDLSGQSGSYEIKWYNPRTGGDLQDGTITSVEGGARVSLGDPPAEPGRDWAVLVRKV